MFNKTFQTIKSYFSETNTLFIFRLKTRSGRISFFLAALIIYLIISLESGFWKNPLLMLYWGFSVFYAAALSETAWIRWIEWKEKKLEHQLKEYANFTWEANTPDGAFLCNLDGEKYLKSKFESEICLKSMFLQTLNTFWVIWNVVVRTIAVIPSLLVFGALLYKGLPQDGSLDTMTIGQLLDSNLLLITFYCILVVNFIIFMMKGLSGLPGYKSYKGVKLTRLLSKDYPILSNASEFNVTGHKLDPEKSEESLIAV